MDSLLEEEDLRFVFVGGKGGVGKTTTSSGLATALATAGKRVLLVSTDPAHSLGDAWRTEFNNDPKKVGDPELSLWVMEVDPSDSMKEELGSWTALAAQFESNGKGGGSEEDMGQKIKGFQEWLSGIPGIDEATALSSAINHIESGEYDVIVFDTAPTGHTVKLLQLPAILQAGLDKLESWTTTIYSYWETFKGAMSSSEDSNRLTAKTKKDITEKLNKYKASIQRVGKMLTDSARTRFVVVCIAEFLSVNETRRLLSDLRSCDVKSSHVVVNQLVQEDACLDAKELAKIEKWANSSGMSEAMKIVATKAKNACELTSSRRSLQSRYLEELRSCEEVKESDVQVVEVPLLTKEVTGAGEIENFSQLLTSNHPQKKDPSIRASKVQKVLYEADAVDRSETQDTSEGEASASNPLADKVKALLEDPEIKELISKQPKAQVAIEEIQKNPMSVMTYMADPDMQPLVQAAMKKLF